MKRMKYGSVGRVGYETHEIWRCRSGMKHMKIWRCRSGMKHMRCSCRLLTVSSLSWLHDLNIADGMYEAVPFNKVVNWA